MSSLHRASRPHASSVFFFNDTATTEIYTLSLHDALPISLRPKLACTVAPIPVASLASVTRRRAKLATRSEEHTSELQSQSNLVCRLLLEKKKAGTMCRASMAPKLFESSLTVACAAALDDR